jgi:hypothetical protein
MDGIESVRGINRRAQRVFKKARRSAGGRQRVGRDGERPARRQNASRTSRFICRLAGDVTARRRNAGVPKIVANHGQIDARLKKGHSTAVAKHVWRHAARLQRGQHASGLRHVLRRRYATPSRVNRTARRFTKRNCSGLPVRVAAHVKPRITESFP